MEAFLQECGDLINLHLYMEIKSNSMARERGTNFKTLYINIVTGLFDKWHQRRSANPSSKRIETIYPVNLIQFR